MHIYNGTNIKSTFASSVQANCPFTVGDNNLSPLDLQTPTTFDSDCFMNLMSRQGLLHSGQEPFNGGSADSQVTTYASNQNTFFTDFAAAMVIMGNIIPLTGNDPIPNSKDCANCGGHGKDPRPCCAPHFNVSLEQFDGSSSPSNGQLSSTFYDKTCPKALSIVKAAVKQAVAKEKRMGASLLRLHFHDCFVNGCDGSILLDDSSSITGEKTARPNANSVRGFDVIDNIKTQVEAACSGIVSCADISAIAARDSVVELGGPSWTVQLGRRDSRTVSLSGANSQIPAPTSSLNTLISSFCNQGLSTKDMIALSGAHTIGQVRCTSFRSHIYNETNINSAFANSVKAKCPSNGGDNNLSPLDVQTPTVFDNKYYVNLKNQKGLLHSDHELFNGGYADSQVTTYSNNQNTFFSDFVAAMVNMGNLSPLTGTNGEVRKNCRKPN